MHTTMLALSTLLSAGAMPTLTPLTPVQRVWQCGEFTLSGIPAAANPYDPDVIAVDVSFTGPSGRMITLPAFWYQPYTRSLDDVESTPARGANAGKKIQVASEKLTPAGEPGWRVRFTPLEPGTHRYRVTVTLAGKPAAAGKGEFTVAARAADAHGFVRVEPREKRYFQRDDGTALPLLGECACWHGARGTYDYDEWFAGFQQAGMNYTRLWMWPHAFGIEALANERLHYNQERAWQLDYVLQQATARNIAVMLCLDYHGMFQEKPDMWGGNNYWPQHPYNVSEGGPCRNQNEFFTSEAARALYRKRLRYLIGRYAALPGLMSWQFFNEINNVYNLLNPTDVVAWHDAMAGWLHAHDPYRHLVTTSFGSAGEQPEMWKLASLDYAQYHLYLNWGGGYKQPAPMAADVAKRFTKNYGKPIYVGEFGTTGAGWQPEIDPYFRGLQQGIWGGILGGTAGTVMPWWWEGNHNAKLYPIWGALHRFLDGTGFGSAAWHPAAVSAPTSDREIGDPVQGATPFTVNIALTGSWGEKPSGKLRIAGPEDGDLAPLHPFLHGTSKPDLAVPCVLQAAFGPEAQLIVHVNSVSENAVLAVKASGKEIFRRDLPNKDGKSLVNNEYNEDITVPLPAGVQEIELYNPGGDWINVDRIRLAGVLPRQVRYTGGIPLDVYGMTDGRMALVWALNPRYNYPNGRMIETPETVNGAMLTVEGLPDGDYTAEWWHTREGRVLGATTAACKAGRMELPVVPFAVDVAARVRPRH